MPAFTTTQGRYLAFIHQYITRYHQAPAESEIAQALCVRPPSANHMVRSLEQRELISRVPGAARSIKILLPENEIPIWNRGNVKSNPKATADKLRSRKAVPEALETPKIDLYILDSYIASGPIREEFQGKRIARVIEIRADNTLADMHEAMCKAYQRHEDRAYEFNIGGTRRFCPDNKNYGLPELLKQRNKAFKQKLKTYDDDARRTRFSDLNLSVHQPMGYCFDFEDNWYHFIVLEKIETTIPTVDYPRLRRQVGIAPPQFDASLES